MNKARLETLINDYSAQNLGDLLYEAGFEARPQSLSSIVPHDTLFTECLKLGELKTVDNQKILVVETKVANDLSERSSRKRQFDIGKKILQSSPAYAAGLFVFYDEQRNLRLSLIYPIYQGTKRKFSPYKRFSFYVSKHLPNKTFRNQFEKNELRSLADFRKAFSLSAVTKKFYEEFKPEFDRLADSVIGNLDKKHPKLNEDFALLFIIRTIFVGFVQKRKWIANNENFLEWYWGQYKVNKTETTNFYNDWLMPLFFNAFNTPFGSDEAVENLNIPDDIKIKVKQSPYLNGGIFTSKNGVDTHELTIPDSAIETFFAFIFSYNFTIEENTAFDEDLELNPEFLGIIFEKLVNKDQGAIYTPRTEVDFMCRISLVKWLKKKLGDAVEVDNLYRLFFRETGNTDDQRYGDFSNNQKLQILEVLNKVTICDPAVGSGAFPVGMLQVLDEIDEVLRKDLEGGEVYRPYERKKEIIKNSLYGVEVKEWAVWITQLRLWITLFIDAPDSIKESQEPILPTLDFKIRQGDSLVQRLGSKLFPVQGVAGLGAESKRRLQNLIEYKRQVYENEVHGEDFRQREEILFKEILSEQVKAKRKELEILLKDGKPQQSGLFTDQDIDEQRQVTLFEKEREVLEAEMDDLQRELSALNSERPLIWSIEFAEIFSGDSTGFDIVIGNPPYVRQEEIGDPLGYVSSARSYKELLFQMVQQDEPLTREKDFKIDGKSDLYAFFYVRGLRLLNKEGVLTFICSNSWLDVGYGTWLQRLFLQNSSLEYVFDNHSERSFEEADVNTTINLFHAPKTKINKIIKFVAFKKPFEEIVHSDSLVAIEQANQIEKTEEYRVYPAEQSKLLEDSIETENSKQKFIGDKWGGKYLRAPDIYFTILEKGKDKLVKLKSIGDVKRGITTGANAFFYLTKERALELKIEEEFLFPVITSPRESRSVVINPDDLGYRILICNKTKKELAGTHILKYIEWGENEKIEIRQGSKKGDTVIGYHNLETNKNRLLWWSLGERKVQNLHFNYLVNEVGKTISCNSFASDNFQDINLGSEYAAILNSTFFALMQNVFGRANFGGGLMKIQTYELKQMLVLDLPLNSQSFPFLKRDVQSIFKECGIDPSSDVPIEEQEPKPLADRAELDKVIFDALELTEDERKDVYRALCRLVYNRLNRASTV